MTTRVEVDAGVCGNRTVIRAKSDDGQHVTLDIVTGCDKIKALADALLAKGPIDAYAEMGAGANGVILTLTRQMLVGCCSACAVPIGIFKAVQVCTGLALPKDITIAITQEE